MLDTTYFSDINAFLTKNVPLWDRFGKYIIIFLLVTLGKLFARYLVAGIRGGRKDKLADEAKKSE